MKSNHLNAIIAFLALATAFALGACSEPAPVPEAPGAATLVPGDRQLALSWEAVEGATAYEVWFGADADPATAVRSGGDIEGTTHALTGLTRGVVYHVWLKAKNEFGTSGFGPVASGNEGEWTLLWVSFSKRQVAYRRNYFSGTGGHLCTFSTWHDEVDKGDYVYSLVVGQLAAGEFIDSLDPDWIEPDYFVIGNAVRIFNGNNPEKYSNAVTIGD